MQKVWFFTEVRFKTTKIITFPLISEYQYTPTPSFTVCSLNNVYCTMYISYNKVNNFSLSFL